MANFVLLPLLLLTICIVAHEFGHFAVARLFGIKVPVFSVGFGPMLLALKSPETEYRISLIPLGGYVEMDDASAMSRPRWQRFCVFAAGPLASLLLGVAVMAGVYMVNYEMPGFWERPAVVGYVIPGNADGNRLQRGDRIMAVNGCRVGSWKEAITEMSVGSAKPLNLVVHRGGENIPISLVVPGGNIENFFKEFLPVEKLSVKRTIAGSPAATAGILPGDRLLSLNGDPVLSSYELKARLQEKKENPVRLSVMRGNAEKEFTLRAMYDEKMGYWILGVMFREDTVSRRLSPWAAANESVKTNVEWAMTTLRSLGAMVAGKSSTKQLTGPIGVAQLTGEVAKEGTVPLFTLLAVLTMAVGLFNILPIPMLDGGGMAILLVEMIRRKDFGDMTKNVIQIIGLAFIVLLFVFVCFNDISKIFGK